MMTPITGPCLLGPRGQNRADHQRQPRWPGSARMVERAGAGAAAQGCAGSLRLQRARTRRSSSCPGSRTHEQNYVSFDFRGPALLRSRHRGHLEGTGRRRRAHPGTVLALAERLPRMLLLLLGVRAARLRQRRAHGERAQRRGQLDAEAPHRPVCCRRLLDTRLISTTTSSADWERWLRFQIEGTRYDGPLADEATDEEAVNAADARRYMAAIGSADAACPPDRTTLGRPPLCRRRKPAVRRRRRPVRAAFDAAIEQGGTDAIDELLAAGRPRRPPA